MSHLPDPDARHGQFVAGHHAAWAGAYFQRVVLVASLSEHHDDEVVAARERLFAELVGEGPDVVTRVAVADALARKVGIDLPDAPRLPEAWPAWSRGLFAGFAERLGLEGPQGAAFTFGWDAGQIRATLAIAHTARAIDRVGVSQRDLLTRAVRDLIRTDRRWRTSGLLLARSPGLDALFAAWRPVVEALELLTRADLGAADEASLDAFDDQTARLLQGFAGLVAVAEDTLAA